MRWLLPVLLVPSIARAQQPIPCRATPIGFACPGDLICNTQLLQCVSLRPPEGIPCQQSPSGFICPGDLICSKHQCVAPPHHPHALAMRNSGMALTIVGLGMFVFAVNSLSGSGDCGVPDNDCEIGPRLLFGSFALLGLGIPFWAVGEHWLKQYPERAQLFIMPVDGGAVAGVRLINF